MTDTAEHVGVDEVIRVPSEWDVPLPPEPGVPGRPILAIVLAAALVGSVATMAVARVTGWGERTVVERYVANTSQINERPADIQGILLRVLPAVVAVTARSDRTAPFFGQVASEGTGIVVSADGEILTNFHVISDAVAVTVTTNGSTRPVKATVVGADPGEDLALLKIPGHGMPTVRFGDSSRVQVGDGVVAVGYALGLTGGPTVTDGIISATDRDVVTDPSSGAGVMLNGMLQTDAAISSGNSGGPLVDADGEVIGITTVLATSTLGSSANNIGFAIAARTAQTLLPRLRLGNVSL